LQYTERNPGNWDNVQFLSTTYLHSGNALELKNYGVKYAPKGESFSITLRVTGGQDRKRN